MAPGCVRARARKLVKTAATHSCHVATSDPRRLLEEHVDHRLEDRVLALDVVVLRHRVDAESPARLRIVTDDRP